MARIRIAATFILIMLNAGKSPAQIIRCPKEITVKTGSFEASQSPFNADYKEKSIRAKLAFLNRTLKNQTLNFKLSRAGKITCHYNRAPFAMQATLRKIEKGLMLKLVREYSTESKDPELSIFDNELFLDASIIGVEELSEHRLQNVDVHSRFLYLFSCGLRDCTYSNDEQNKLGHFNDLEVKATQP